MLRSPYQSLGMSNGVDLHLCVRHRPAFCWILASHDTSP
ncbi:Uncharacterised protein [Vibrio cholerae]|nr:Uncharacterised protein [Vibrio cholerae]